MDNNGTIKEHVSELEAKLCNHDASMGSIIVHSLRDERAEKGGKCTPSQHHVGLPTSLSLCNINIGGHTSSTASCLPDPSPSQTTLGKCNHSATPDSVDGMDSDVHEPYGDAKLQAIHWVMKPRKRAHLEANVDNDRL